MEQIFIQIRFSVDTEVGNYSDALYFTEPEYFSKTRADIDALKQQRINNFVTLVKTPAPIVPDPTKEELQKIADSLQIQLDEINKKLIVSK